MQTLGKVRATPLALPQAAVTFAPLAWLKLQFFCHAGDTEIGGFGISSEENLLYIEDFVTVRQQVTPVTVRFEDAAVADYLDACVDRGLHVEQCGRIWIHTHPGASVTPSAMDEETFGRSFGGCDWSLMFILGRTGRTYARLAFAAGPGGQPTLPSAADWSAWPEWLAAERGFLETEMARWQQEYASNIVLERESRPALHLLPEADAGLAEGWPDYDPYGSELEELTDDATAYDLCADNGAAGAGI
jgi:proteasome lid subunit RPN8/RPN11